MLPGTFPPWIGVARSARYGFCGRTFAGLTCRELREYECNTSADLSREKSPIKHIFFSTMSRTRMPTGCPQVIQVACFCGEIWIGGREVTIDVLIDRLCVAKQ